MHFFYSNARVTEVLELHGFTESLVRPNQLDFAAKNYSASAHIDRVTFAIELNH